MSFLGFSSASAPPIVTPQSSLSEALRTTTVTHSRGPPSRKHARKARAPYTLRTFNTAASQPAMLKGVHSAGLTAVLSMPEQVYATTAAIATQYVGVSFALSAFSEYTKYTALFDQYRIEEIEMWIAPNAAQGTTIFGSQNTCIDYDDANTPPSIESVISHQESLTTDGSSATYIRFRPHMAVALFSGTFTSYGNEVADWIDSASPSVQHYGVKSAFGASITTGIVYVYHVRARISFRQPGI